MNRHLIRFLVENSIDLIIYDKQLELFIDFIIQVENKVGVAKYDLATNLNVIQMCNEYYGDFKIELKEYLILLYNEFAKANGYEAYEE